jgi:hypothetical protein
MARNRSSTSPDYVGAGVAAHNPQDTLRYSVQARLAQQRKNNMSQTINPTAAEFAAMLAEVKVAERACSDARGSKEEDAAGQRVIAASDAILSARPTDPAAQLRFLVADPAVRADTRICGALEHIADQLEALAGGVVLSAGAAAQIRTALLAVLQDSGGGIEPEDDPDLSPGIGLYAKDSERQTRAAYRLVDQAARRAAS